MTKNQVLFEKVFKDCNDEEAYIMPMKVQITKKYETNIKKYVYLIKLFEPLRNRCFQHIIRNTDIIYNDNFFINFKIQYFDFQGEYNFEKRKSDIWVNLFFEDINGRCDIIILNENYEFNFEKQINDLQKQINDLQKQIYELQERKQEYELMINEGLPSNDDI